MKLEKKYFYSEDELLTKKIPYYSDYSDVCSGYKFFNNNVRYDYYELLISNLLNVMFTRAGYSYEWAKEHDLEDLPVIDIVWFKNKEEYDECRKVLTNILIKQMGFKKTNAEKEISWFELSYGLSFIEEDNQSSLYLTENKFKEFLKTRIKAYEDKHGELKYSDGYEKTLKDFCNYKNEEI